MSSLAQTHPHRDLFVRLSVTSHCQLGCSYCLPEKGCERSQRSGKDWSRSEIVKLLGDLHRRYGIKRVRFTGGEPLLRRDLPDLIEEVAGLGIAELAMTTNGQLLAPKAAELRRRGLQRINISIDSMDPQRFREITRGGVLSKTLDGIAAARDVGLTPIKLNMVVLRGVNDGDLGDLLDFAFLSGSHLRFLELMPIGVASQSFAKEYMPASEMRERLTDRRLHWTPLPWDPAETSRDWLVRNEGGRETVCGFITPTSQPFCGGCRRLRITSDGWLYGCLAKNTRHSLEALRYPLEQDAAAQTLEQLVATAFKNKQGERFVETIDTMALIGG